MMLVTTLKSLRKIGRDDGFDLRLIGVPVTADGADSAKSIAAARPWKLKQGWLFAS